MIKDETKKLITQATKKVYPNINIPAFAVTETAERFGDYATNIAMKLSKIVGERPEEIAKKIIKIIGESDNQIIAAATFAGPGFINFKIALPYLQQKILEIIEKDEKYGSSDVGEDRRINIEFISANPTGPLTVGNSRGGVIGDVLANIFLKIGWKVTREYYFNDAGGQIDILGHSILKDDQAEYKGEYIDKLNKEIKSSDYREVGKKAAQIIIDTIKKTTKKMGINFDVWFAEGKDLRDKGKIDEIINWLKEKDLIYDKDGALWFFSTKYGDDKDRVLIKSDGEPTYFALDCAYHKNKFIDRKFDRAINVWGADHYGDLARLKGFVQALGYKDKFHILLHQFVRIVKDGCEVRMSKRAGNYITVDDLLKEVGKDVYRFFMLEYAPSSHLTFDLELAKERSQKNPVYYIQYAYARISSILNKCKNQNAKIKMTMQNVKLLQNPAELSLLKELIKLPELVEEIVGDYQVQKLPVYGYNLATKFHNFYEKCSVLASGNNELTSARIQLLKATQIVLKNTLDLMGIFAPTKM